MASSAVSTFAQSSGTRDDDLSRTLYLLNQLDDFQQQHFPFMRGLLGLNILFIIGHRQACGIPMNLTEILDTHLTSISTAVRHLRQMEKFGVLFKRKARGDKRNVLYFVAPEHLTKLRALFSQLADSQALQLMPISEQSTDSLYREARDGLTTETSLNR